MTISSIKIHPAIGIARLGNSPYEFFIGPELPNDRSFQKEVIKMADVESRAGLTFSCFCLPR